MLLEDKTAVIYGAAGGIGTGVARTFAAEGARVFLAGRTRETLEAVAGDITTAGGRAEVAVVDALDEAAVTAHADKVVAETGGIDLSFNLITRGDVQGIPLLDMAAADFTRPTGNGLRTQFLTARAAARRMAARGSGVILSLTSGSSASAGSPHYHMGGSGPADAAVESFMRYLAAEVGPRGVRVVGLWTSGVVETLNPNRIGEVNAQMGSVDMDAVLAGMAQMTMLKRGPRLKQISDTAAFLASDRAAGTTCTIVNVSCGLVTG